MALNFIQEINLTADTEHNVEPLFTKNTHIMHEPSGDLYLYYMSDYLANKQSKDVLSVYSNIQWEKAPQTITSKRITNFGVKHFPQIGAHAFYTDSFLKQSFIMAPVHKARHRTKAPEVKIEPKDDHVDFTITENDRFDCYRVTFKGTFSIEYISYKTTFSLPVPAVNGDYQVYVQGYVERGLICSLPSDPVRIIVTDKKESWIPEPMKMPMRLSELEDVSLADILNEQLLSYDASTGKWFNRTIPDGDKEAY